MITNEKIEEYLETLPDLRADALDVWRKCTLEREAVEADLFVTFKRNAMAGGWPAGDDFIQKLVEREEKFKTATLCEIAAETIYERHDKMYMAMKKMADIRKAHI